MLDDQTHALIKTLPLFPFSESPLFNHSDPLTLTLPASELDIVTNFLAMELLIPDEILTLLSLFYSPLSSMNGMYPSRLVPELKSKIDTHSLQLICKEANMIAL